MRSSEYNCKQLKVLSVTVLDIHCRNRWMAGEIALLGNFTSFEVVCYSCMKQEEIKVLA